MKIEEPKIRSLIEKNAEEERIKQEILKEVDGIPKDEIPNLNFESFNYAESHTDFLDWGLQTFKSNYSKELEKFNNAIRKTRIIDLGFGSPADDRCIFYFLYKGDWKGFSKEFSNEDHALGWVGYDSYNRSEKFRDYVDSLGLARPAEYIGVDKNVNNKKHENPELNIKFEKEDMIHYLMKQADNSANIFLCGFDEQISRVDKYETRENEIKNDKYRLLLSREVARVLSDDGYLYIENSLLFPTFTREGRDISFKPEDFGLEEVPDDKTMDSIVNRALYRKKKA